MKNEAWILLAVLSLAVAGGGCRLVGRGGDPSSVALRGDRSDSPAGPAAGYELRAPINPASVAVVRSGFILTVTVQVDGRKEIDEASVRVSEEGDVRLPLVGSVPVAGLTLTALRDKLTDLYLGYFVRPQVGVDFVVDGKSSVSPWGTVTILGRVKNPGQVALPPTRDLSVVAAIQAAGGFDTSADQGGIRITRRGPAGAETHKVNLRALATGARGGVDVRLVDGDVVYIPELMF